MKFLIYKIYRISLAEDKTIDAKIGFQINLYLFELLHYIVVGLFVKAFDINLNITNPYFLSILLLFTIFINYYYFIRNKMIYKINKSFEDKMQKRWVGNLLFILYILGLFLLIVTFVAIYQRNH